ncbi:NAD(P)/FAD-dependent oxidoreductase [Rhodococcus sp. NCIMB 12038]|uniref:NAD(P)/FAD-dependent oxidoreductase n=1 Tax=Rhodococcus sp. NCIMB 12038 TaxID=933800 RepID=UPI000B3CD48B|nr:FAD-dependent oxidoreductase [Rhodococcus sp. NCIMB 12038]OUS92108.1 hypothetical protein CA951_29815 [Rhodococcus sp. NCIMB 12038]
MSVVIIGAGHAGVEVASALRILGDESDIVLVDAGSHLPYERPPLSKAYLKGEAGLGSHPLRSPSFYEEKNIECRFGSTARRVDRNTKRVMLDDGEVIEYDKLVLATGGRPRALPIKGAELAGVHHLVTSDDAASLRSGLRSASDVVIVGGGYIGLEVAAAARSMGKNVTVVEVQERLLSRVASGPLAQAVLATHCANGVEFRLHRAVVEILGNDRAEGIVLDDGSQIAAELVVVGIGSVPETDLASLSGVACGNGIIVDSNCRSSDPDIFAIGDVACRQAGEGTQSLRLESVQNAVFQARTVAGVIAGAPPRSAEVPWFWSDQYDMHIKIAGLAEPDDDLVIRPYPDNQVAVSVLHLRDGRLTCIETLNATKDFIQGKKLISSRVHIDPVLSEDSRAKLTACQLEKEAIA